MNCCPECENDVAKCQCTTDYVLGIDKAIDKKNKDLWDELVDRLSNATYYIEETNRRNNEGDRI